jgi:hypothetical protein
MKSTKDTKNKRIQWPRIILQKPSSVEGCDIILAFRRAQNEYVVWNVSEESTGLNLQSGFYTTDVHEAVKEYRRRS